MEGSANPQNVKQRPSASRRRDKPQLSCNLCRRRKLKCDRAQPCQNCSRRGLSLSCSYVSGSSLAAEPKKQESLRPLAVENMQGRIGELERLVVSLMQNGGPSSSCNGKCASSNAHSPPPSYSPPSQDPESLTANFGKISLENTEVSYVESSHWTAILDGIAELKDCFEDSQNPLNPLLTPYDDMPEFQGPDLLFGGRGLVSKEQILATIPARLIVDRLVAKFFTEAMSPVLVHGPTFLVQYERFWICPSEMPVMWLGLLFSILCMGTIYNRYSGGGNGQLSDVEAFLESQRLVQVYREGLINCLILGKYIKCAPFTIETLIMYLQIENFGSEDTQVSVWVVLGITVNLALRMGYHRDASNTPRISPFQAEMRRRVWLVLSQIDLIVSSQFGLPRSLRVSQADTKEPSNLLDEDFGEFSVELPPSRPDTDQTPIQFAISKNKLATIFGTISDFMNLPLPVSYEEIMRLDKHLLDTYYGLPSGLHMKALAKSITDDPDIITHRLFLVLLFHKTQCILHRKYLRPAKTDNRYSYSRTLCIDAALHLLEYQQILHEETQPGARFFQYRSKVTSLIMQDLLLGTTILCLDLDQDLTAELSFKAPQQVIDFKEREKIVQALQGSYRIWLALSPGSKEAQRAVMALRIVLGKAHMVSLGVPSTDTYISAPETIVNPVDTTAPAVVQVAGLNFDLSDIDFVDWDSSFQFTQNVADIFEGLPRSTHPCN